MSAKTDMHLIGSFEENQSALERNLDAVARARSVAEQNNLEVVVFILNVGQFAAIFNYDLSILRQELLSTESEWRKRLYARLLALTVVEFFEDIGELSGKVYRNEIALLGDQVASIDRLKPVLKQLSQLRAKHEKDLRLIRNIAIGHRDKNAKAQIELINKLDIIGLQDLALDITDWLTSFIEFQTDVINTVTKNLNKPQT
jgi:hypothetical protein